MFSAQCPCDVGRNVIYYAGLYASSDVSGAAINDFIMSEAI